MMKDSEKGRNPDRQNNNTKERKKEGTHNRKKTIKTASTKERNDPMTNVRET